MRGYDKVDPPVEAFRTGRGITFGIPPDMYSHLADGGLTDDFPPELMEGRLEDERHERLAWMFADGKMPKSFMMKTLNISYPTLINWSGRDPFRRRVRQIQKSLDEMVLNQFYARRANRLEALTDKLERMHHIMERRSEEFSNASDLAASGGGDSGLIARQYKSIGGGPYAEAKTEYHFDAALMREYRATINQIAVEAGQAGTEQGDGFTGIPAIKEIRIFLTERADEGDSESREESE